MPKLPAAPGAPPRAGQAAPPADGDTARADPLFSVVRGQPTTEEVAALTVVLTQVLAARSAAAEAGSGTRPRASHWADRSHLLRAPVTPGPGAWRRSALSG